MKSAKIALSLLVLILASALSVRWLLSSGGISRHQIIDAWSSIRIPASIAALLFATCVSVYFADAIRYRVFANAFGIDVSFRRALRATTACFLFSWISPYGALGPPAAAYLLQQEGMGWEDALLVSYGKSLTGAVLILAVTTAFIALGYLPGGASSPSSLFLLACLGFYVVLLATPPMRARLKTLMRAGLRGLSLIACSHLLYFAIWSAICVLWCSTLGAPIQLKTVAVSTLFVTLLYMSPTPSGAGVAELTAASFFTGILNPAGALILVVLFRVSTYGAQIVFGLVYFGARGGRQAYAALAGATSSSSEVTAPSSRDIR